MRRAKATSPHDDIAIHGLYKLLPAGRLDGLAEAHMIDGHKERAKNDQQTLKLDPKSDNAAKMLARLEP